MHVETLRLPDVKLVHMPVHGDRRGSFTELVHATRFAEHGLPAAFPQANHSHSRRGALRGLHYQLAVPQGKLVRPLTGSIFDVAVDVRQSSPTFGQWVGETLTAGDGRALWVPEGFAHGFLVLSETADVWYACTACYDPTSEHAVAWNDPEIGIAWPLAGLELSMSPRDAAAGRLADTPAFA